MFYKELPSKHTFIYVFLLEMVAIQNRFVYLPNDLTILSYFKMLGHLKPKSCHTNPAHKAQYQEMYCSICASLRRENGLAYSFLLNHELTLVMLALKPYMPEAQAIRTACPAKAYMGRQGAYQHEAIALAGKLSIVLGWVKATDWATDRPAFYKTWLKNTLTRKVKHILPTLSAEAQETIAHYLWLTKTNSTDFEEVNRHTGLLSETLVKSICAYTDCGAENTAQIAHLFGLNGKLVSIADHLIDAEKDLARNEYNPIFFETAQNGTTWTEGYEALRLRYNRLKMEIFEELNTLQDSKVLSLACTAMLRKAIQNLDSQIVKCTPYFLDLPDGQARGDFQPALVKADCDACGSCCDSCGNCGDSCDGCSACCDVSACFCSATTKTKAQADAEAQNGTAPEASKG